MPSEPSAAEIGQLTSMGAPRARAIAALQAKRNDVMAAAEAVFGGEFDHIAEDADDPPQAGPGPSTANTKASASTSDEEMDNADEDEGSEGDAFDFGDDSSDQDHAHEADGFDFDIDAGVDLDAYAGLDMSKDRRVETTEVTAPARAWAVPRASAIASAGKAGIRQPIIAVEMNSSEWLSGCPEGSEQQLLFGAYSQLRMGHLTCPTCQHPQPPRLPDLDVTAFSNASSSEKNKQSELLTKWPSEHLLLLFPRIEHLVYHLLEAADVSCVKCKAPFCGACSTARKVTRDECLNKAEWHDAVLYHCGRMQTAVLGCGLTMIAKYVESTSLPDRAAAMASVKAARAAAATHQPAEMRGKDKDDGLDDDFLLATCSIFDKRSAENSNKRKIEDDAESSKATKTDKRSSPGTSVQADAISAAANKAKSRGIGYSGDATDKNTTWKANSAAKQKRRDELLAQMLRALRAYLPSTSRPASKASDAEDEDIDSCGVFPSTGKTFESDWMPDFTTLAHLRRRFLPLASSLLSSDSLMDMIDRQELFIELLRWFTVFARHETLCPIIGQPIMHVASVKAVTDKDGKVKEGERTTVYEGRAGPMELMQSIIAQCRVFKSTMSVSEQAQRKRIEEEIATLHATAEAAGEKADEAAIERIRSEGMDAERGKLLSFCDRIISIVTTIEQQLRKTKGDAAVDRMLGSIKAAPAAGTADSSQAAVAEEARAYEAWAKPQVFADDVDMSMGADGTVIKKWNHVFNNEIEACKTTAMRRSVIISKELSTMQANLPYFFHGSIFVRRDESRVDVLKALIVGPEGSPYESGCYLFDLFLPATYNQEPPKCKIVNTKGGQVRHNPNLYAEGKVCLSLLGTWSGPGWQAGHSTILQVLLSIQSLVLCAEPSNNEPGWESLSDTDSAHKYTRNIRRMNIHVAMLELLKNPPQPWADVIRGHFFHKRDAIKRLLDKWGQDDDGEPLHNDGASLMGRCYSVGPKPVAKSAGPNTFFKTNAKELIEKLDTLTL